ncbi:unnamed protein product, partial [Didymodactylos carnosus]
LRPLHYASWQGRTEPVFLLLRRGANVNEQSISGDTALHLAAQYGHNDVVQLLLFHQADPTIINRRNLTPIDLACENGRCQVVNSLLQNHLCLRMLNSNTNNHNNNNNNNSTNDNDNSQQSQPNCLHLAAKNGHSDIVRLLLLNGMDINKTTTQGTALHEAGRNGRYEAAKVLLECGIDINICNSYEQTAYEVVIKQKPGNDIKRLIKEFSDAVSVCAIRSYTDNHVGALNFQEGDYITVLERNPSGEWRGFILKENLTTRIGYFPSTYVQLVDRQLDRSIKETIKENDSSPSQHLNHNGKNNNNRGLLNGDLSPVDSLDSMSRVSQADSGLTTSSYRSRRGSPNSSCRHSTASSVDSGRSSTAISVVYDSPKPPTLSSFMTTNTPLSYNVITNLTNGTISAINDARSVCSSESKSSDQDKTSYRSSNSSLDRLDESLTIANNTNLNNLLRNGVPENEIVLTWLRDFSYEDYYENFIANGYDIHTITRMTPEDLTAIGITHPSHRRKLKNEIGKLRVGDRLPDYKPDSVYDWLCLLRLNEYIDLLHDQNYKQIDDVMNMAWEDLEDIGITRLGHQKRFMLGVKRLQDIKKGLYQPNSNNNNLSSPNPPMSPNGNRFVTNLPPPSTPCRQSSLQTNSNDQQTKYRPLIPNRQTKPIERCNSVENNNAQNERIQLLKRQVPSTHRSSDNDSSSSYATLRKPPTSPNSINSLKRPLPAGYGLHTSSFRLPSATVSPPLPSATNLNMLNLTATRTRSLENINGGDYHITNGTHKNPFDLKNNCIPTCDAVLHVDTSLSSCTNDASPTLLSTNANRATPTILSPRTTSTPKHHNTSLSHSSSNQNGTNHNKLSPSQSSSPQCRRTNSSSSHQQQQNYLSNLQVLCNLSSSTESNCIPFANENIGTIKQRSTINGNDDKVSSFNPSAENSSTIKRSLPIEFFEQRTSINILKPSYPITTAIYDNNERYCASPTKLRSLKSPSLKNGNGRTVINEQEKRLQYIEMLKKEKEEHQNKSQRNDTSNVLHDIDDMLSDLNRELDAMLEYETTSRS